MDIIALLIEKVWPHSLTPLNLMGGFRKCGIYPLNPGAVIDQQIVPLPRSQSDCSLVTKIFYSRTKILFSKGFEVHYVAET